MCEPILAVQMQQNERCAGVGLKWGGIIHTWQQTRIRLYQAMLHGSECLKGIFNSAAAALLVSAWAAEWIVKDERSDSQGHCVLTETDKLGGICHHQTFIQQMLLQGEVPLWRTLLNVHEIIASLLYMRERELSGKLWVHHAGFTIQMCSYQRLSEFTWTWDEVFDQCVSLFTPRKQFSVRV